ncbi:MAG: hypothetical protein ABI649_06590 [Gaiellaceae bacterium]
MLRGQKRLAKAGAPVLAMVLFGMTATLAPGHVSPPACAADHSLAMDMSGLNTVKRNGDVLTVAPTIGNVDDNACDVTDATVTLAFPNPDGSTGDEVVSATGFDLLAGQTKTFPALQHTVDFNPGVFRGFVWVTLTGVWHSSDPDPLSAQVGALGRPLVISRPHVTLTVTPDDPGPGAAPFAVTYTYTVENDSPPDPVGELSNPTPGVVGPVISDDACSDINYVSGDTTITDPPIIQLGETWTFTCSTSLGSGPVTNHVTFTGGSTRDGRPWPVTTAQSTVTVNGPDMTLTKSHTQTFTQGDIGRIYKIVATNVGNAPSTGLVTVTEKPPGALKPRSLSGTGWHCTLSTLKCTRSNALPAGASYPAITLKVDVKGSAPANIVNKATISRAGENTNDDLARDPTVVARAKCAGLVATIVGTQRANTLRGTNHRDIIAALGGNDVVHGRGGNDLICGGSGSDSLFGGPGRDRLLGGPGRDSLQQ